MRARIALSLLLAGCAGAAATGGDATLQHGGTSVRVHSGDAGAFQRGSDAEVAYLEIRANGLDRFATCPPAGTLGQGWIPPIPPWTPPAAAPADIDAAPPPPPPEPGAGGKLPLTATEKAIEDTRIPFRDCYHRGLVRDRTQAGRAAVVVRLDTAGRPVKVELWGACRLTPEVLSCMRGKVSSMRFAPPADGQGTLVLPAVFANPQGGGAHAGDETDAYTASAYLAVESLRPALHACEEASRKAGLRIDAFAELSLQIDANGRVVSVDIDPWGGEKTTLACAAEAIQKLELPPPQGGRGHVIVRLAFNPPAEH
jgi:hypothetical protein